MATLSDYASQADRRAALLRSQNAMVATILSQTNGVATDIRPTGPGPVHMSTTPVLTDTEIGIGSGLESALGAGWNVPEDWGVWSYAHRAWLVLPLARPAEQRLRVTLDLQAMAPKRKTQQVRISARGRVLAKARLTRRRPEAIVTAVVRPSDLAEPRNLELAIDCKLLVRPSEIGVSVDQRRLGIGLRALIVSDGSFEAGGMTGGFLAEGVRRLSKLFG